MFFDLLVQFTEIQLAAFMRGKSGAIVDVVEQVLIRHRAGGGILRQSLKDIQIALRSGILVKVSLHHRQLVVAGGGIAADFDITAKEVGGFGKFLVARAEMWE